MAIRNLYHYTTASGLAGIIQSKSIWASDYRFLNDATEFKYGLSVFEKAFDRRLAHSIHPELFEIVSNFQSASSGFCAFVASFSQHQDLLSQWRGYNGAVGFSIGINCEWLAQNAVIQKYSLIPVCYDASEQVAILRAEIELLGAPIKDEPERRFEIASQWWMSVLVTIASLKDATFAEEGEWRLVKVTGTWPAGVAVRSTSKGLVPYEAVKLDATSVPNALVDARNFGLDSITLGPGLREQQRAAVDALLATQRARVRITKSIVPFSP